MKNVYHYILSQKAKGEKLFAVLVDPEKCFGESLAFFIDCLNATSPDLVLVGGSQLHCSVEKSVAKLKLKTSFPVVLFPGNSMQFASNADAILLLSLISGRNPDFLIGQQVKVASALKKSMMETIPTGYILLDGGLQTAVERVSGTIPISQKDVGLIVETAIAGELMGNQLIYLEAGSGAKQPVLPAVVSRVKEQVSVPLVVGGGICNVSQLKEVYAAGADMVVVGNYLESHPEALESLLECRRRVL